MSRSWFYLTFESELSDSDVKTVITVIINYNCFDNEIIDPSAECAAVITDISNEETMVDNQEYLKTIVKKKSEVVHVVK